MKIKAVANTYLVAALLLGSLMPVMLDIGTSMSIYEFLFFAYALAVPSSLIGVFAMGKKERLREYFKNKSDLAKIAAIGLLNYAFLEFGMLYAERFISASLATVIYRTSPLLMLIFLPVVLRERISSKQVFALLLAFAGLFIAITGGRIAVFSNANSLIVLFMIAVAFSGALATVLVKRYMFDMISSMFIFNLANFAFFAFLFAISGAPLHAMGINDLLAVVYVGIVYNVITGFMYYDSLRKLKTTFVTNIYFLSPFLTFVFAGLMLHEPIELYYVIIAVLVSVGIVIQQFDLKGGSYLPKSSKAKHISIFDVTSAFANTNNATVYNAISGNGRALAIKIKNQHYIKISGTLNNDDFNKYGVYVFSDADGIMSNAEREFVREVIGADSNERVIITAGSIEKGEEHLSKVISMVSSLENAEGESYQNYKKD